MIAAFNNSPNPILRPMYTQIESLLKVYEDQEKSSEERNSAFLVALDFLAIIKNNWVSNSKAWIYDIFYWMLY